MFEYNRNLLHIVDTEPTPPPHEYLAYFPFKTDMLDVTWNFTLTNHGGYIQNWALVVDDVNSYLQLDHGIWYGDYKFITINMRFYYDEENTHRDPNINYYNPSYPSARWEPYGNFLFWTPSNYGRWICLRSNELGYWDASFYYRLQSWWTMLTTWNWYNIVVVQWTEDFYARSPDIRIYLNGELAYHTEYSDVWWNLIEVIWNYQAWRSNWALWKISEFIVDNVKRTDSEILSYYNRTKNNYPN